jgi:hypothetical protein
MRRRGHEGTQAGGVDVSKTTLAPVHLESGRREAVTTHDRQLFMDSN